MRRKKRKSISSLLAQGRLSYLDMNGSQFKIIKNSRLRVGKQTPIYPKNSVRLFLLLIVKILLSGFADRAANAAQIMLYFPAWSIELGSKCSNCSLITNSNSNSNHFLIRNQSAFIDCTCRLNLPHRFGVLYCDPIVNWVHLRIFLKR